MKEMLNWAFAVVLKLLSASLYFLACQPLEARVLQPDGAVFPLSAAGQDLRLRSNENSSVLHINAGAG